MSTDKPGTPPDPREGPAPADPGTPPRPGEQSAGDQPAEASSPKAGQERAEPRAEATRETPGKSTAESAQEEPTASVPDAQATPEAGEVPVGGTGEVAADRSAGEVSQVPAAELPVAPVSEVPATAAGESPTAQEGGMPAGSAAEAEGEAPTAQETRPTDPEAEVAANGRPAGTVEEKSLRSSDQSPSEAASSGEASSEAASSEAGDGPSGGARSLSSGKPDGQPEGRSPTKGGEQSPGEPEGRSSGKAAEQSSGEAADQPSTATDRSGDEAKERRPAAAAASAVSHPAEPTPMPRRRTPNPAWRRLWLGFRPSRGQAIVAIVLGLVGFMAVVQVRVNRADDGYANARREDLIAILDGLGQNTRRLEGEIRDLEKRKTVLSSGADKAQTARQQAQEQAEVLGILAGTLPAQGPGVRITLKDPEGKVTSGNLLDAIEELRDAGAEAIQINSTVRVVASTDLVDDPPGVRIDGQKVGSPYVIEAIGESHNLAEATNFPGGLVSEVTGPQIGGTAEVTELKKVKITALHTPEEHRYARPAASPTK